VQIVGYRTGEDPGLLLSDAPAPTGGDTTPTPVEFVALDPGTDLAYTLGERRCAGTVTDEGHLACDADGAPYCDQHTSVWVCARCTGTCLKDEMDCFEEHAVYLAAFAPDRFKVGVTRLWRLDTRLREQGADRAAHVRTVENGRVAREIEAGIATDLPDRVRVPTKVEGLGGTVAESAWDALLAEFDPLETFSFDYGLALSERPVAETIATGTVRGVKGRVLVLDHAGSTYAVDLRDLVGYELEDGRTDRDVQSSLGAFG
jgi:hypothetical protein